jgi:hypothetical protein
MVRIGIILCCLLVSAQATAASRYNFKWQGMEYTALVPSPHWYAEPLLGSLVVNKLRGDVLATVCRNIMGFEEGMGCMAWIGPGESCHVYVNRDLPYEIRTAVLHHEIAHCHGWPSDHSG